MKKQNLLKFSILSAATATAISDATADKIDRQTPTPQSRIWSSQGDLLGENQALNSSLIDQAGGYTNYSAQSNQLTNLGTAVNNPTTDGISNTNSYNDYVAQTNDLTNLGGTIPAATAVNTANAVNTGEVAASSAVEDLGVITVTGYQQNLRQAPATISVVSKEDIENKPFRDLGDLVQEVPGVTTSITKTGTNSIQMRGMSSDYTLLLVDGKPINLSKGFDGNGFDTQGGYIPAASMIEQVEVLRGPASTRYGSSAMGGVVNIITKPIPDHLTASVSTEARLQEHPGTWGNVYGANLAVAAPINEQLGFNLHAKDYYGKANHLYTKDIPGIAPSAVNRNGNPYIGHASSGYVNKGLGGRISFKPDEQNSFYLDQDYIYQRIGTLNTSQNAITAVREYHKYNTVLNHDGKYSFGDINTWAQYSDVIRYAHGMKANGCGAGVNLGDMKGDCVNHDTAQINQNITVQSDWKKTFDFANGQALTLNAGPSYSYERLMTRHSSDKSMYQLAGFAEGEYKINDQLSTTAGVRATKVQHFGTFYTPRLYANIHPTDNFTIKAGIATGMKAPPLATLLDTEPGKPILATSGKGSSAATTATYRNGDLKVEKTINYEIGGIWDFEPASVSLTGFYTDFRDAIGSQSFAVGEVLPHGYGICGSGDSDGADSCSMYENVDKAVSKGVEAEVKVKPILDNVIPGGVGIDLAYGFNTSERKTGDSKGQPLTYIPRHKVSAKVSNKNGNWNSYLRYVGNLKTPANESYALNTGRGKYYKDMHIVDLGLGYKFNNGLQLQGVVNNLFDTNFNDMYAYNNGTSSTNLYQKATYGRNYWLNLRYDID
ncbi:MAG: TonB-dependent receptor [Cardiobacteriaceae bacterium]|nr:TonB-dependent receptor [Cardiobacteriaceae bacterium]